MKRPPQRFVIRRVSRGAATNLPWCLYDSTRPHYVGRFATWTEARNASTGAPNLSVTVLAVVNRGRSFRALARRDRARQSDHVLAR